MVQNYIPNTQFRQKLHVKIMSLVFVPARIELFNTNPRSQLQYHGAIQKLTPPHAPLYYTILIICEIDPNIQLAQPIERQCLRAAQEFCSPRVIQESQSHKQYNKNSLISLIPIIVLTLIQQSLSCFSHPNWKVDPRKHICPSDSQLNPNTGK